MKSNPYFKDEGSYKGGYKCSKYKRKDYNGASEYSWVGAKMCIVFCGGTEARQHRKWIRVIWKGNHAKPAMVTENAAQPDI